MLYAMFSQLVATERHAQVVADAERRTRLIGIAGRSRIPVVVIATTGVLIAVLVGGCATVAVEAPPTPVVRASSPEPTPPIADASSPVGLPSPTPLRDEASPSIVPSTPRPAPTARHLTDAAMARSVARTYERALVGGRWRAAWTVLSSADQALRGTLAAFASERAAYFTSVAGRYTLSRAHHDPATLRRWTSSPDLVRGANLKRAYIVQADYPALANNNAGFEVLLVAPNARGAWRIWEVR
jgi:hypothetical protein